MNKVISVNTQKEPGVLRITLLSPCISPVDTFLSYHIGNFIICVNDPELELQRKPDVPESVLV